MKNLFLFLVGILTICLLATCEKEDEENKHKPGDEIEIDDFELLNDYSVHGNKWNSCTITYIIENYSPDLDQIEQKQAIEQAFRVWSNASGLNFVEVTNTSNADIKISFDQKKHPPCPFDFGTSVLAHAYYPPPNGDFAGDIHFNDEAWDWTVDLKNVYDIDLITVAIHEIGHSLGLKHSEIKDAIMYPRYTIGTHQRTLHQDDINGILAIYDCRNDEPDIDENLLLYLPCDGNAKDATQNGYDGTVHGATLTGGVRNCGYQFNGEEYIEVTKHLPNLTNGTICFWFYADQELVPSSEYCIFIESDPLGDTNGDFIIAFNRSNCGNHPATNDGKIYFELQGDQLNKNYSSCSNLGLVSVSTITASWQVSTWHFITVVLADGQIKIYKDGLLENTHSTTSTLFRGDRPLSIGKYIQQQEGSGFNGRLDEIRVYSKALTNSEIMEVYNF